MIALKHIDKHYISGEQRLHVLRDISIEIGKGEFVAITGASGSGKSTLMNIIGCLDTPDRGDYFFAGKPLARASDDQLALIRNHHLGFVFQLFNLIPRLSALRNVELPLVYAGVEKSRRLQRATVALKAVGLEDKMHNLPAQLSGGQQQRVAIARALVTNPDIIVADEPTGSLDSRTATEVMDMFKRLNETGKTIIFVTHDLNLTRFASRLVQLHDGQIVRDVAQ